MLLVLLSVVSVLLGVWTWRMRTRSNPTVPPYCTGVYPIVGHTHFLLVNTERLFHRLVQVADECCKKGGIIRCMLGPQTYYVITDPEDILTAANGCLNKHFAYDFAKPWLGDGLITSSGPIWKRHRHLLAPSFSLPILHGFLGVFNKHSRILVKTLTHEVGNGLFDAIPYLSESFFKSFCTTAVGIEALEDKEFMKKYMKAVDILLGFIMMKFTKFWFQSEVVFKLTGLKQQEDHVIKVLNDMYDAIIQKKRASLKNKELAIHDPLESKGLKYRPLLDLILELSENNIFSDKEIRDELNSFTVAGYDTSSLTIAYTLMLLGTHPDVQDRVYKEIQDIFGDTDRDVEKTDLSQLKYIDAVIKEALRLYPVVPALLRHVEKSVQLKKFTILAGSEVILLIYGLNRHPVWGEDVHEFRPQRWLEPNSLHNTAFGSFSMGKRYCMGQNYAMMSVKTTIVHVIRNFRITSDISKLRLKVDFMLKPVEGCKIALELRNKQ